MRQPTLDTLGLGSVLEIFERGAMPVDPGELADRVFGDAGHRGSLVVSGANGIVGAGKTMQLGSRLLPFSVPVVALDFPGVPDGIGKQYPGLIAAFGREGAVKVMENIVRLAYDGTHLPARLGELKPRFLLEAIPEILDVKKSHYEVFRAQFPNVEIRSVTSGFPSSQLGVGIAHPAFPHEINKVWEVVEPEPSAVTQLFWALGLIPISVADRWSFVLDVVFCGLTLSGLRAHRASNIPFWKADKYIRRLLGPNPFRAHDAIGAKGANFLTWSCLFHLSKEYGDVFAPTPELHERRTSGQDWYPPNHFRPLVDWKMDPREEEEFNTWVLGPLFQMTSLVVEEKRAHLSCINMIGELCAQFRKGVLAVVREHGATTAIRTVEAYHKLHPAAARTAWYPQVFDKIDEVEWQQLYVNGEHNGNVGVITIGRESYNGDVNAELNRAIDWLKSQGIARVIVTGDFHLSTQMVGADTSEFFPALDDQERGYGISHDWSRTARRLHDEFEVSVGFVNGKRCLGGMLELMMHCHYLVSVDGADLGMPEVTLPVIPGMEGCHWPFRKTVPDQWPMLLRLLLEGRPVKARDGVGWLVDYAGPLSEALRVSWKIATGGDHGIAMRQVQDNALAKAPSDGSGLSSPADPAAAAARAAILDAIRHSCQTTLSEALTVQAKHSAGFMAGKECRRGTVGAAQAKTMAV